MKQDTPSLNPQLHLSGVRSEPQFSPEIIPFSADSRRAFGDSRQELISVFASIFRTRLTEHESFCIYYLLSTHLIDIRGLATVGPLPIGEIASILAILAGEYPKSFLREQGVREAGSLPPEVRKQYWEHFLTSLAAEDPALSYHDRHAIARLRFVIEREPRIASIIHID